MDGVTLRPLGFDNMHSLYSRMSDIEFNLWGGWTPVIEIKIFEASKKTCFASTIFTNTVGCTK
ncbi:MAG TPA: hypothetical protein VKV20_00215 [Ktedonobacteraceae bacterium]|nr:hypothetical protein [Ktedonobacteraceae bacterium]